MTERLGTALFLLIVIWLISESKAMIGETNTTEEHCTEAKFPNSTLTAHIHELPDTSDMRLHLYAECRWRVDLSATASPFRISTTYFNERDAVEVKDDLESPDTLRYLEPVKLTDSEAYKAFPYFLLIRGICDEGYYSDLYFHAILQQGVQPEVKVTYVPPTSRSKYNDSISVTFKASLVNLNRDALDTNVPENRKCKAGDKGKRKDVLRQEDICYPAFAIPLMMLHVPIFALSIPAVGPFQGMERTLYIDSFHSRKQRGSGQVESARVFSCTNANETHSFESINVKAKYFFPNLTLRDSDSLAPADVEILEGSTNFSSTGASEGPLDDDDFFNPQFTFGSAPAVGIAGFYRPDLAVLTGPDMFFLYLFNWYTDQSKDRKTAIFDGQLKCLEKNSNGEFIPMYARPDIDNGTHYYRRRYDSSLNYTDAENTQAIFEIIGMEDRLLLVTTGGLVTLYAQSEATVNKDKVYVAVKDAKYCYKFVRILRMALMSFDPVLAVTYKYKYSKKVGGKTELVTHDQDVHYTEYRNSGEDFKWIQIGQTEYSDEDVIPPESGTVSGTEARHGSISEAMKICMEVRRSLIDPICTDDADCNKIQFDVDTLHSNEHECEILDGSPIPTRPETIQLLVTMTFTYYPHAQCIQNKASADCLPFVPEACFLPPCAKGRTQKIRLYVIAEHTVRKVVLEGSTWKIASVVPQIPCRGLHHEAIKNILPFSPAYFREDRPGTERQTCYWEMRFDFSNHLHLTRMTYTRQVTNHVFLYGNRLIHSSDAGKTFILTDEFPVRDRSPIENLAKRYAAAQEQHKHKIKVIAFSNKAQYAFLTSQREVWVGTTGSQQQIRVRPSRGYSIARASLYQQDGITQGYPISILYDSHDKLFELVAVKNASNGEIINVVRRHLHAELIFRNQYFVDKLKELTESTLNPKKKKTPASGSASIMTARSGSAPSKDVTIQYNISGDMSLHCAFNSFEAKQNYSKTLSRMQRFVTSPPLQHMKLGQTHTEQTLKAYQVATHTLMYETFLRKQENKNFYSRVEKDSFELWKKNKASATFIGYIKYYKEDPKKFGIVVDPRGSIRLKDPEDKLSKTLIKNLYLNYNQTIKIQVTFYIKNAYLLGTTNFRDQSLDLIQLNVDNANGDLVELDTSREPIPEYGGVRFTMILKLIKNDLLKQAPSGLGLLPIPLTFHFINSFGTCLELPHWGMTGESMSFTILAGCPPATDLLFDWNSTLQSLKFRHQDEKYGYETDCHNGAFVCYYAKEQIIFHFDVLDLSKQAYVPFTGRYKMKVVGGGRTEDEIVDYSQEEQEAYNIPGRSDVSLIWTTAQPNSEEVRKLKRFRVDRDPTTQENILESGVSRIRWSCNTLSPCARIAPTWTGQTIFWFKINITNNGIDSDTLCHHERTLKIMVYGFPPSPELLLFITLLCCTLLLLGLLLLFYCCRRQRKVWRSHKLKIWGWLQIVTDTFPKPLKNKAGIDEKAQLRTDSILLSLQGHLRVPSVVHKPRPKKASSRERVLRLSGTSIGEGSDTSIASKYSQDVLPQVHPRKKAETWTEMVYEQIISRRLLAIVERNKRMRDAILRRAQAKDTSTDEEETEAEGGGEQEVTSVPDKEKDQTKKTE